MYMRPPPRSPSEKPPLPPKAVGLLLRTFEDSLLRHLNSLRLPLPDAGVSFSYLSRAAAALSTIHAAVGALLSDPSLRGSDPAALCSYMNSSIKLLDVCNALSSEVERLLLDRLLLLFVVHLLSTAGTPPPEKIRKAREAIREWQRSSSSPGHVAAAADLVRDLQPLHPPSTTALGGAIRAAEATSALVAGALVAFLGGELDVAAAARASPGSSWGEAFNGLGRAIGGEASARAPGEMEAVEASVRKLADVMDGTPAEEDAAVTLRHAVKAVETATEELTAGLKGFGGAVGDLFRALLRARNAALQGFCPGSKHCK